MRIPTQNIQRSWFVAESWSYKYVVCLSLNVILAYVGFRTSQVSRPYNSTKTIFVFSPLTPTSVQHIAWAVGPFHIHAMPAGHSAAEDVSGTTQLLMHSLCLPVHKAFLSTTVSFMRSAMNEYVDEYGSYPFRSHRLVFVKDLLA